MFRVQRLTPELVRSLLGQADELDALVDLALQRELAVDFLKGAAVGTGAGALPDYP